MTKAQPIQVQPTGLSLGDIYYVLFRHKWKLLSCVALAVAAAVWLQRFNPPPYQSEAKLYVRYIIADKAIGPAAADATAKSPDQGGETIMNSETEILTSVDLARQVAEAIGPEKILAKAGGGNDLSRAIALIKSNLVVTVPNSSSVIHVVFRHPDPELVQPVLREIVERYLKLHVEAHTANGIMGDFLTQETDQLRSRLSATEEELRKALNKAGVISVEDAKKTYAEQTASLRREIFSTEADLAQRISALDEIKKRLPAAAMSAAQPEPEAPIPPEILDEYRSASRQVDLLQRMEQELLTQFTAESPRVAEVHGQLTTAQELRNKLQTRYPRLSQIGTVDRAPNADVTDAIGMATQVTALKARLAVLNSQLIAIRTEAAKLEQTEGTIVELRRKKDLEEANYRYYSASLEQARINETLGNGRVANIIQIQKPSPPLSDRAKLNKMIGLVLFAGFGTGLAWVFFIELYFDRSIKRAIDVERNIPAPLLLSIPAVSRKRLALAAPIESAPPVAAGTNGTMATNGTHGSNGTNGTNGANGHADLLAAHPLLEYHETLRDRLIGYFESIALNHKPKLVAVTALHSDAGVTTTAAGLARSLSETGEGNVLLVDMNADSGVTRQFTHGRAVRGLDEILDGRDNAVTDQKLYIVSENSQSDRLSRNMPHRFMKLVPKLKASDFDYIIFDMPPVSQISITPRLAGFMDMVLLVVESEKTDRELVHRATELLSESRAHVGIVLNKTHKYVPTRLHQATLAN